MAAGQYSDVSDQKLAEMLTGELDLHMMNDTSAREKVLEAVRRLKQKKVGTESQVVRELRKELADKNAKLSKIEKILLG